MRLKVAANYYLTFETLTRNKESFLLRFKTSSFQTDAVLIKPRNTHRRTAQRTEEGYGCSVGAHGRS
jgi:hypothetical protein